LRRAFGDLPGRRIRDVPVVESEARALARAEMLRRSRGFVQVRGTTAGTPQLVVGSRVTLARCGRPFDGDGYYVTRCQHSFDLATGVGTRCRAERRTVNTGGEGDWEGGTRCRTTRRTRRTGPAPASSGCTRHWSPTSWTPTGRRGCR